MVSPLKGIDGVRPGAPLDVPLGRARGVDRGQALGERFSDLLGRADDAQREAQTAIDRFVASGGDGLVETVLTVEKASLSFETLMRVRGKVLEAYQEIMHMQV